MLMHIRNRQGGIEMLRFIAMYFVALNHTAGYGALGWNDQLYVLYIPTTWAVPLFVAISGWFGIRFSWRKIVNFASFILFYSILFWTLRHFVPIPGMEKPVPFEVRSGWFGGPYLALLVIAPILTAGMERLCAESKRQLIGVWSLYFALMAIQWLPLKELHSPVLPAFHVGGWEMLSFNTLMFYYVTARTVRLCGLSERISTRRLWLAFGAGLALLLAVVLGFRFFSHWGMEKGWLGRLTLYNSPLGTFVAIPLFLIFERIRLNERATRFFCFISPSLFAVYLMHYVNPEGKMLLLTLPTKWLLRECPDLGFGLNALSVAAYGFVISILVDLCRRAALQAVGKLAGAIPRGIFQASGSSR